MNTVIVKNIAFGEGKPKVCVPMIGRNIDLLKEEARILKSIDADLIEWRVDFFDDVNDIDKVEKALSEIRKELIDIPLLFTLRSEREGGECSVSGGYYFKLYDYIMKTGEVDIIDIELFSKEIEIRELIEKAHGVGVKVIVSNHDFDKTPPKDEIISRLCKMQEIGADLPKIAVIPKSSDDVLTLLEATNTMKQKCSTRPIITISMGNLGVISRLSGELFGSCMTFGSANGASAPGQIEVKELKNILDLLHVK
jgi:3-dehydroquinate dehydratase-1